MADRKVPRVHANINDELMTQQHMKDQTDINRIVKRHASTGLWDHLSNRMPLYGDFSEATDLHEAMNRVDDAWDTFNELPPRVRSACDNDPRKLLAMLAIEDGCKVLEEAGFPFEKDSLEGEFGAQAYPPEVAAFARSQAAQDAIDFPSQGPKPDEGVDKN